MKKHERILNTFSVVKEVNLKRLLYDSNCMTFCKEAKLWRQEEDQWPGVGGEKVLNRWSTEHFYNTVKLFCMTLK